MQAPSSRSFVANSHCIKARCYRATV